MSIETIRQVLKRRDNMTDSEIDEAFEAFGGDLEDQGFECAEELLAEHFGLEPDYLFDPEIGVF